MLDIVCTGKDAEGTYKVVKHLLDNVGTMYVFRKSGLYKHMKFRDVDEAILDGVKQFVFFSSSFLTFSSSLTLMDS